MEFSPHNPVVKLCLQGMSMEDAGKPAEALSLFMQAWNNATSDFEKFTAAYYVARQQKNAADKLKWYQDALQLAMKVNDDAVKGAYTGLYMHIANCYEELGDADNARKNRDLAVAATHMPTDSGPFYHGSRADLQVGDMLTARRESNYQQALVMNHIYFTALANGAGLAAALAKGNARERVYVVRPTGPFENDPNVTDKKFPGNPTRSYRTEQPLQIVGELTEWDRITPEQLQQWREKLANNKGEIIN